MINASDFYRQSPLLPGDQNEIAQVIQENIRGLAPVDTGYGREHTFVTPSDKDTYEVKTPHYMMALNRGFKPFLMTALAGKTIPIRLPSGQVIFRRPTSESIGRRRILLRDENTGQILPGNRPIAWRHPGQRPLRFIEKGLDESVRAVSYIMLRALVRQSYSTLLDASDNT